VTAIMGALALLLPQVFLFDHYRITGFSPLVVGSRRGNHPIPDILVALALSLLVAWLATRLARGFPRLRPGVRLLMVLPGAVSLLVSWHQATRNQDIRRILFQRATLTGRVLARLDILWDRDGDTFAPTWLGGGDPDDGDPGVHPLTLWAGRPDTAETASPMPGWGHGPPPEGVPRPLNILLISDDTLRADHLGCYGYPFRTSPVVDSLAARGILFENCRVPLPKTSASLASLLTGKPPAAHGVRLIGQRLDARHLTLAEILAAYGYATYGITRNGVVSATFGFDQGFRRFRHVPGRNEAAATDTAIAWLESWQRDDPARPFLLWIHYLDPHGPYDHPRPYGPEPSETEILRDRHPLTVSRWVIPPYQRLGTTRVARYLLNYDGEIASVDREVGRLLAWLRRNGLEDRTLVIFTSDHGESFTEHDFYFEHGDVAYEDNVRVPLILSLPGILDGGRRVATQVSTIDVVPTVLHLLEVPPLPGPEGLSLLDAIRGEAAARQRTLHILANYVGPYSPRYFTNAVCDGRWKLIYTPEFHIIELYDLRADPLELDNLWGRWDGNPEARRAWLRLRRLLARRMIRDRAGHRPEAPRETRMGEELLEQLRSLGYVN
jgi:arylsulfatase A-like enzyme